MSTSVSLFVENPPFMQRKPATKTPRKNDRAGAAYAHACEDLVTHASCPCAGHGHPSRMRHGTQRSLAWKQENNWPLTHADGVPPGRPCCLCSIRQQTDQKSPLTYLFTSTIIIITIVIGTEMMWESSHPWTPMDSVIDQRVCIYCSLQIKGMVKRKSQKSQMQARLLSNVAHDKELVCFF